MRELYTNQCTKGVLINKLFKRAAELAPINLKKGVKLIISYCKSVFNSSPHGVIGY